MKHEIDTALIKVMANMEYEPLKKMLNDLYLEWTAQDEKQHIERIERGKKNVAKRWHSNDSNDSNDSKNNFAILAKPAMTNAYASAPTHASAPDVSMSNSNIYNTSEYKRPRVLDNNSAIGDITERAREEVKENNEVSKVNKYPEKPEDVIKIAESAGIVMQYDEADKYLTYRIAAEWTDGAGRKILPGNSLKYDVKKWHNRKMEEDAEKREKEASRPRKYTGAENTRGMFDEWAPNERGIEHYNKYKDIERERNNENRAC